ncbi:MAG: winged helix-turn-helix transcriptional regulator [Flavobacteriales bacterium]|nr:winged helix-turn-helix transcriptional regulator [Flavobacteriales bacterium]
MKSKKLMTIESELFRINRYLNQLAQTSDFSSAGFEVLRLIKERNPITLRQLCEIQQVSMPTMSKLVDGLQNEALVIRALSKEDARQRWIVPTQKGIAELARVSKENRVFWDHKLNNLSDKQKQQLNVSLKMLSKVLSDS